MKKLFFFLALISIVAIASAQTVLKKAWTSSNGYVSDTLTNTETAYYTSGILLDNDNILEIGLLCTNISGTTAGTAIIQGSIDGTNWMTDPVADTLTLVDAAYHIWVIDPTPYAKYRVSVIQTGTSTTSYPCFFMIKK